jgi:hypothetical protein
LLLAGFFGFAQDARPSLPGLTRQSIFFAKKILRRRIDPRVKPAGDTTPPRKRRWSNRAIDDQVPRSIPMAPKK